MSDSAGRKPEQAGREPRTDGRAASSRAAAQPNASAQPNEEVLVQICIECGKEYTFDDDPPPENLTCEKCGGTVFRTYYEPIVDDEVSADFKDATERDLATSDPEGDTTQGDLVDLNNL